MSEAVADEVCIINIGPQQRMRRRMIGVVAGLLSLGLAAWLWESHANHFLRLLVALPLFVSAIGFFQAREKT